MKSAMETCPICPINRQCDSYNRKYCPNDPIQICVGRSCEITQEQAEEAFREELRSEE